MKLFSEPFDLDKIETALTADRERFSSIAFLVLGVRANWDDALIQVSDLYDAFDAERRDTACIDRLFDSCLSG